MPSRSSGSDYDGLGSTSLAGIVGAIRNRRKAAKPLVNKLLFSFGVSPGKLKTSPGFC